MVVKDNSESVMISTLRDAFCPIKSFSSGLMVVMLA